VSGGIGNSIAVFFNRIEMVSGGKKAAKPRGWKRLLHRIVSPDGGREVKWEGWGTLNHKSEVYPPSLKIMGSLVGGKGREGYGAGFKGKSIGHPFHLE